MRKRPPFLGLASTDCDSSNDAEEAEEADHGAAVGGRCLLLDEHLRRHDAGHLAHADDGCDGDGYAEIEQDHMRLAEENEGLQLFFGRGRCSQCHVGDLFVGDRARNNGLDTR